MGQINPNITIRPVYFGMLLLSVAVMIFAVHLTIASDLDSLEAATEQGDAEAQFNLGNMYFEGLGVPQNDAEAARLYRMAAEQGIAEAQFNLGVLYSTGRGVPENDTEAARLYRMAAEQGIARAQFNLGVMYFEGLGVPQNDAEAARLYRMAAEQGDADVPFNLAYMYFTGRGVPRDYVQVYAWLNIAAAQGYEPAKELLENITKEMPTADITKAKALSREYWEAYGFNRASSE